MSIFSCGLKQRIKATTAADCHAKTAGRVFLISCTFFQSKCFSLEKTTSPDACTQEVLVFSRGVVFSCGSLFFFSMFLVAGCIFMDSFYQDFKMFIRCSFSVSEPVKTFKGTLIEVKHQVASCSFLHEEVRFKNLTEVSYYFKLSFEVLFLLVEDSFSFILGWTNPSSLRILVIS